MTLADRASRLAEGLDDTIALWRPSPFHDDPPWVTQLPALAGSLLCATDNDVEVLESDPDALADHVARHLPAVGKLRRHAEACVDETLRKPLERPESAGSGVPGRKWRQALHFASACDPGNAARLIDWCCGKAHLGRLLADASARPVTGIERDARLCEEAGRLALRASLPVQVLQRDALELEAGDPLFSRDAHAVALHACGDLHLALLREGSRAGIAGFTVAPCCYHLCAASRWQPASNSLAATRAAGWHLTRGELHLAVQETVTASARTALDSRRLAAWRLGFDRLQRDVRAVDAYLPTPSRPARVLSGGFPAFCRDMATHHSLPLPADTDFPRYEAEGHHRQERVRRLDLLRHAFRRPLEILLVADRALLLAEQGYRVRLVCFCPRKLTPRNLAILASRTSAA